MLKTAPIVTPIIGEDRLSKDLKKAQSNAKKFAQNVAKFGQGMTKYVSAPIAAAGVAALKFSMDFNKSLAEVATLIPGEKEKLLGLKSGIQELSIATGKSTEDLTSGAYEVISALGPEVDTMNVLETSAKAAAAGMSTTKEAFDLLSAVAKGYNDVSEKSIKDTADLAFMTVKLGKTSFPELAAAVGNVVPQAAALNVSQKELFGTFATLTGVTGGAAEVSTQMKGVLQDLIKPSTDMAKSVKKLGFESSVAMIKTLGFQGALKVIGESSVAYKKLDKAAKGFGYSSAKAMIKALGAKDAIEKLKEKVGWSEQGMGKLIGRSEAMTGVFALLGTQAKDLANKTNDMNKATGAMGIAYNEVMNGINKTGATWEQTKRRLIVLAQRVGDKLIPVLTRLFDKIEPWLVKLEKMDEATLEWGLNIAKWAVMVGPAVLALGRLNTGFLSLIDLGGRRGNFSGLTKDLSGIGGAASGAASKVGKLRGLIGKLAKGAGTIGIGLEVAGMASAVTAHVVGKAEKKAMSKQEYVEKLTKKAEKAAIEGAPITKQQKLLATMREEFRKLPTTYESAGGTLWDAITTITGSESESRMDRYEDQWNKMRYVIDQLDINIKKQMAEKAPKEQKVKIDFKADVPGKATVTTEKPAQTGAIMGGL